MRYRVHVLIGWSALGSPQVDKRKCQIPGIGTHTYSINSPVIIIYAYNCFGFLFIVVVCRALRILKIYFGDHLQSLFILGLFS